MSAFLFRSVLREEAGGGAAAGGSGAGTGAAGAAGGAGAGAAGAAGGAAAPAPWFKGLYDDTGKIDKGAFDRLPDSVKQHADVFKKYDTIEQAFTGFANAHSLASKKNLTPLDPNAPPHVRAERKALLDGINNVPKEAKDYGIARPQDFPEEYWNQAGADKAAEIAHRYSIPPEALKELIALQIESSNAELAKGKKMEEDFYKGQDAEFAKAAQAAGMNPEKALEIATRGAATLGLDVKSPIFRNAAVRLAMAKMTSLVSEDKLVAGAPPGGEPTDFRAQARDIINNPQNPLNKAWNDQNDPRNAEAKAKVHDLWHKAGKAARGER